MNDRLEQQSVLRDRVAAHDEAASDIEVDQHVRRSVGDVERLIENQLDAVLAGRRPFDVGLRVIVSA